MTLWWIGDIVLLVVVVPVVVYLLHGVLSAARSIVPSVRQIADVAAAGSKDLDATALLIALVRAVRSIEKSVDGLLEVAPKVAASTANIPQLEATAPVLALIVEEAVVQDGYMNALTDGFGGA